ncbi:Concanavalin A-like lectin/glucanases superfamily protein [Nocardioides exalbidus]|uniref:Concanavalin A-like lectin/glucanases superfamily protein n=1 Tax=Nocardioides exalbidus TaxID=402596 RepID=A0A1H4VHE9_9ACTN|nr:LamG domain-containing protein [Nocardioides exalbidus]SEC79921.1 Concanavalin A-like lectin/glucanases superfamily protein [Nocardioides exalbidus]
MHRARRVLTSVLALTSTAVLGLVLAAPPASARADSLAGLWLMDEGAGQVAYDLSLNGNRGYLGSSTAAEATDPSWVQLPRLLFFKRAALRFSGSQRVTVPDAPSLEPSGVTLAVRVRSDQGGYFRYIAAKGSLACETASYGLYTGAQGGARFYVSDGSSFTLSNDAGPQLWDGQWHTVVGTYDGTSVRLWVDGRQVGTPVASSISISYDLPDSQDLLLGDYAGSCGSPLGFIGDMDAAAVIGRYQASPNLL